MACVVLLLITAFLSSSQTQPVPGVLPGAVGAIHGLLSDTDSGAPLPNCSVQILGADASLPSISSGGAEGRYFGNDIAPGQLLILARCPGRHVVYRNLRLDAGQDITLDFRINGPETISGHVLDQRGSPITDTSVWVIQAEYRYGALHYIVIGSRTTGKAGEFVFESDLEAGRAYYVLADPRPTQISTNGNHPSLDKRELIDSPTYYGDATSLARALPVTLLPGEHRDQIDIKVLRTTSFCVDGDVNISGKPAIVGFSIYELSLVGTKLTRFKGYPADDGTFRACNLTAGQYWLSATASQMGGGEEFSVTNSDIHGLTLKLDTVQVHLELSREGAPPAVPLVPTGSAGAAKANISMAFQSSVSSEWTSTDKMLGTVGTSLGNSIDVALIGQPDGANRLKSELAPYDGSYGPDIPIGNYAVQVRIPTNTYLKELTYGGVNVADRPLRLVSETNETLRVLVSDSPAELAGAVFNAEGSPVAYATVVLLPDSATTTPLIAAVLRQLRADQRGTWVFDTLAPGRYRVLALTRPVRPIPEDMDRLLLTLPKATKIELMSKGSLQIKLQPVAID